MTLIKNASVLSSLAIVAACAQPLTPTNANYNELREDYPDLTAVEFSLLDQNNDGFVDAEERALIGNEDDLDGIEVSD